MAKYVYVWTTSDSQVADCQAFQAYGYVTDLFLAVLIYRMRNFAKLNRNELAQILEDFSGHTFIEMVAHCGRLRAAILK